MYKMSYGQSADRPSISSKLDGSTLIVHVSGDWNIYNHVPNNENVLSFLQIDRLKNLKILVKNLGKWDNSLVACIVKLCTAAQKNNLAYELDVSFPSGLINLVNLALTVPAHDDIKKKKEFQNIFIEFTNALLNFPAKCLDVFKFIGEMSLSFLRLLVGRASCNFRDVLACVYEVGVEALPIVSLISLLVGLILAFVGVVQLRMFGAEIYVASLVSIGMTRIMGAIMTGIVLAGRTGASYAAIIGSMQVNEEVDALSTLGIAPEDNLVLPRVIALATMTPLLVIYSDFMGILGGYIVGSAVLGIDYLEYYTYTKKALNMSHILVGIVHGFVFGLVVAISGCYQGLRCKRSAEGVGEATTAAVVNAIIFIIISTAILTIFFNILGV